MCYFLEIPCKNNLFVGEIGHGIQQWRTVATLQYGRTLRSVNASFFRLGSAHSDICWAFPNTGLAFHPALLSCSSPLRGSPLRAHCTLEGGYCPEVKIVLQAGVLPKVKTLVSLLSLPVFWCYFF